jgi:hypothetical protein
MKGPFRAWLVGTARFGVACALWTWADQPMWACAGAVEGRLTPGRQPIRATARARINQFAEANNTLRWLRFFAIPR